MEHRTLPARFEALILLLPTILESGFELEEAEDHPINLRNIGINKGVIERLRSLTVRPPVQGCGAVGVR